MPLTEQQHRARIGAAVILAATIAICAILTAFLGGCALFSQPPSQTPVAASEVARLRALPDAKEAAIAAPHFYEDALNTVFRLQNDLDKHKLTNP